MKVPISLVCSLYGTFFTAGSLPAVLSKEKRNVVILIWMFFGIIAQLIHLKMHQTRLKCNKIGSEFKLKLCTLAQLITLFLYKQYRPLFYYPRVSDLGAKCIQSMILVRLFYFTILNRFKYKDNLLWENNPRKCPFAKLTDI